MFGRLKLYLKNFDWVLFAAVGLLVIFGIVEVYSVALGQNNLDLVNFKKQILFALAGLGLFGFFSFLDSHFLKGLSRYIYIMGVVILIAVLIFGSVIRGTRGWFSIAGYVFQPVELIKIFLVLFLADYFSNLATKIKTMRHFLLSALGAFILIILVLLQPDFGSALMLGSIWLVMTLAAGFNRRYFIGVVLIAVIAFSAAWFIFFKDYQKERILTLFNPSANALESGYNSSQAMIAVGSGGWFGKGVGFGSQSQLKFLPEAHTDFIFSVIAEELGFLGVVLILGFYGIFFFRCYSVVKKINNDFGIYFIIGGAGLIFIQMFINIGMNIGIMPVVGLPLPFVSYGGSSLMSLLILAGIMENIIIKSKISF